MTVATIAASLISIAMGIALKAPAEIPPEALAFRAQEMLKTFGYTEKPGASAYSYACCDGQKLRFVEQLPAARRDELLSSHQPPVIAFWYRQSQRALVADSNDGEVTYEAPANDQPKMIRMALDATGRLFHLEARIR